jgi:hypothetical protein
MQLQLMMRAQCKACNHAHAHAERTGNVRMRDAFAE